MTTLLTILLAPLIGLCQLVLFAFDLRWHQNNTGHTFPTWKR